MHRTADTLLLIFAQRLGAAGDAGRYAVRSSRWEESADVVAYVLTLVKEIINE
jgi:hypothetical protein